jgi:putative membrane protein
MTNTRDKFLGLLLTGTMILLLISGLHPYDRLTWVMEVFPILIAVPVLIATRRKFPLTTMLYVLIFIHCIVLMVGGAYSYARVPLGFEIANWFGWHRNPYDKIGHFFQGFVPALIAREIFIRRNVIHGRKMLTFITVCVVLAISASYELIEWASALSLGQGADEFLGTQGDPWDTQSDMFMALVGAIAALLVLSRVHDKQIERLRSSSKIDGAE